ncbi:MAG: ATP-binding cassette domain-containing protein [Clostridia bacterium]
MIRIEDLTKGYKEGRGIFDISLDVKKGEIFGYVGTNGSGKTTTIRHIMGFLRPDSGQVLVKGMDSWKQSTEIMKYVAYIPGEIAFPDIRTGTEFLRSQAEFLGVKDMTYANRLIEKLQLDPSAVLKSMSKGMKQKTAIVAALMAGKEILVLDEPTTGLDPLMRQAFIELILEEKKKGRTIFMSSHIFEEIEDTCDHVALIKDGRLVEVADMNDIRHHDMKTYKIEFFDDQDYMAFKALDFHITDERPQYFQARVNIDDTDVNHLFSVLKGFKVKFISEIKYDLETYFNEIFRKEGNKNDKQTAF